MFSKEISQLIVDNLPLDKRIKDTYKTKIDDKHRLSLPKGLVNQIPESLTEDLLAVAVYGDKPYISLIPHAQSVVVEDVLAKYSFHKDHHDEILSFFARMQHVRSDVSNRILMPDIMRSIISSSKEVYCVGYYYQILIYSFDVYQTLLQKHKN